MNTPRPLVHDIFFFLFAFFSASCAIAAPVQPNQAVATGLVLEYSIIQGRLLDIQPDIPIYRLTLHIESTEDVEGMPNLLKDRVGQTQAFYSKEGISSDVFNKRIKATVSCGGDERGGRWWLRNVETL